LDAVRAKLELPRLQIQSQRRLQRLEIDLGLRNDAAGACQAKYWLPCKPVFHLWDLKADGAGCDVVATSVAPRRPSAGVDYGLTS
jgi:hypothetical protein